MKKNITKRLSIVGTVGLPASYGGFETLAENLVNYSNKNELPISICVYCSGFKRDRARYYKGAELIYVPVKANGILSIFYDIFSLFSSVKNGSTTVLVLGVSGAVAIPILRILSKVEIITNIDGMEWKREKWGVIARQFLKFSESVAIKYSHTIISDNEAIRNYITDVYSVSSKVIAYGGDHAVVASQGACVTGIPDKYFFSLCRIEPENNVELILYSATMCESINLVFIGNWDASSYGRMLKAKYHSFENIYILDPIYELEVLAGLRSKAIGYIHGHSAGGTNPSLVEFMHFGIPVVAFDCSFNRFTTHSAAYYFSNDVELIEILMTFHLDFRKAEKVGERMKALAVEYYTWDAVGRLYFDLVLNSGEPI
ncbi:MAG: DUF1972 domain-containing protein [Gammaproteobacteria bacterium]